MLAVGGGVNCGFVVAGGEERADVVCLWRREKSVFELLFLPYPVLFSFSFIYLSLCSLVLPLYSLLFFFSRSIPFYRLNVQVAGIGIAMHEMTCYSA